MKKVFITTIPLQGRNDLGKVEYIPEQFELKNNRETAFPIIPIIAEHLEDMGETEIIAIRFENDDTAVNYQKFLEEVESLGLSRECVRTLSVPENQNPKTHTDMLLQLIDKIPNHSVIRACITYGTKPVSVIVTYALIFIKKVLFDTEVRGLYYGEILRQNSEMVGAKLYNLINLLAVGEIVEQLNDLEIDNVKE